MNSLILTVFHEFLLLFIIRRNFVRERHKEAIKLVAF